MLKFGEYFAEYDTNADFHYDANGLGRIHRLGAPSAICLSVPFIWKMICRCLSAGEYGMGKSTCFPVKREQSISYLKSL